MAPNKYLLHPTLLEAHDCLALVDSGLMRFTLEEINALPRDVVYDMAMLRTMKDNLSRSLGHPL